MNFDVRKGTFEFSWFSFMLTLGNTSKLVEYFLVYVGHKWIPVVFVVMTLINKSVVVETLNEFTINTIKRYR